MQIVVNGKTIFPLKGQLTYEELAALAGKLRPTITYRHRDLQGSLGPREKINLINGMIFNVVTTGAA